MGCDTIWKDAILVQQIDAVKPPYVEIKINMFSLTFWIHCDIQTALISEYCFKPTRARFRVIT